MADIPRKVREREKKKIEKKSIPKTWKRKKYIRRIPWCLRSLVPSNASGTQLSKEPRFAAAQAHNLFMVLRSDLTIVFFSADTYVRLGLLKTSSQQVTACRVPKTSREHHLQTHIWRALKAELRAVREYTAGTSTIATSWTVAREIYPWSSFSLMRPFRSNSPE